MIIILMIINTSIIMIIMIIMIIIIIIMMIIIIMIINNVITSRHLRIALAHFVRKVARKMEMLVLLDQKLKKMWGF